MIFRQLLDPTSSTYSYLLADPGTGDAVLIDPVFDQVRRDTALLRELGLHLRMTLETHVHADHVTGAWLHQQRLGSQIAVSAAGAALGADRMLVDGDRIAIGQRQLQVRATPGHTSGCLTYVLDDQNMAFTGDSLLIRGCGRTDFQQGDPHQLFRSVHGQIFSLPPSCLLYPGHDYRGLTVTSVAEERRFNPRLGGNSNEHDFAVFMTHLGLAHPKLIDIAVPANLRCGRPEHGHLPLAEPNWAPLTWTFAGLWEIEPHALEEVLQQVQVLDVREPSEFKGPLGHIEGAVLMPMASLAQQLGSLDRVRPLVTVCRSGARSAQAALMLNRAGLTAVANLAGGMLRWRAQGHAVRGGVD